MGMKCSKCVQWKMTVAPKRILFQKRTLQSTKRNVIAKKVKSAAAKRAMNVVALRAARIVVAQKKARIVVALRAARIVVALRVARNVDVAQKMVKKVFPKRERNVVHGAPKKNVAKNNSLILL